MVLRRLAELEPDYGPGARLALVESLHHLDPRAVDCHAEGRFGDLMGDFNGDALLARIGVPVLLLQADPLHGGLVPDGYIEHALALLPNGFSVRLDGVGHGLGLETWQLTPLLGALVPFLESL
jgi:hypothetical protein